MPQLTKTARPKTLASVVGQTAVVEAIKRYAKKRTWNAIMLSGPTGTGKTTCARIIAASLQCSHQTEFGSPCIDCYRNQKSLGVTEVSASIVKDIEKVSAVLAGSRYGGIGDAKYRIYILDEVQVMSKQAQNLLLEYLENSPDTTIYILCTTEPLSILRTIRGRCVSYELRELSLDETEKLVIRLLKRVKSDLPADRLVEALIENNVKLPRHITSAVEKYADGAEPSEAVQVEAVCSVDGHSLCRAMVQGDWKAVAALLRDGQPADAVGLKVVVLSYLRSMLVKTPTFTERNVAICKSIAALAFIPPGDYATLWAALAANLYTLCYLFDRFKG